MPAQLPGVPQPWQLPQLPVALLHAAHEVKVGAPLHDGPVFQACGRAAACAVAVGQQMRVWPEQSSSDLHALGQVFLQIPSQQSSPVAAQSLEAAHAFGHVSNAGLRQRPATASAGSRLLTDVQQISPTPVWHSVLVPQALGHLFDAAQTPWP